MFGCGISGDGNNAHVKEVDEEFVASYLLCFFCTPQQALVEVLSYDGLLVEVDCCTVSTIRVPCFLVQGEVGERV